MKKLIVAIMIFLTLLLSYSLLQASILYTVPVEIITKLSVPLWSESVQGKGREEFIEAVQACKDGQYNEASDLFKDLKERYPGSNAAEIAGLYIGSIAFWNATLNEKKDIKLLMEALKAFQEGLTSSIKSNKAPEILMEIGKIYLELGRMEEAVGSFRRIIKDYHQSKYAAEAQYMMSLTLEKNGKYNEAMDGYKILIQEYKEYMEREGLFGVGRVFFEMREFGEAKKTYEEGLSRWPSYVKGNPEVLFYYSESEFQNGVLAEARNGFLIYYNLYPKTKKSGLALNRVGDTYVLERKGVVAEKIYREVMAIFPAGEDAVRSKLAIGDLKLFFATGQRSYDEAIEYYKEVEESSGQNPMAIKARYKIAKVLEAEGRIKEALGIYSDLLDKTADDPLKSDIASSLASLTERLEKQAEEKMKRGDYLGVAKVYQNYFKQIIVRVPDEGFLMDMADAHRRLYLNTEAAFIYQKLIERKGEKHEIALFKAGELYSETGDYLKAVETLSRYVSEFPQGDMAVNARVITGDSFYNLKEFDKATNYFYSVLRDAPYRYPSAYIRLSNILLTSGQYEESANILKDMLNHIQKGKDDGYVQTAYISLGNSYYGLGKYQDALDVYRMILNGKRLKNDSDTVQFMAGDCLFRLNKKDEAKKIFSRLSENASGLIKQASEERIKDIASGLTM